MKPLLTCNRVALALLPAMLLLAIGLGCGGKIVKPPPPPPPPVLGQTAQHQASIAVVHQ